MACSRPVYVDTRQQSLESLNRLVRQAQTYLQAERAMAIVDHAHVKRTEIQVDASAFQKARSQDGLLARDTGDLTGRISGLGGLLSSGGLLDWRTVPESHDGTLDVDVKGGPGGMRLVEELESPLLDGARMLVFEAPDADGKPGYFIGLESSLFDENGDWLSDEARGAYSTFLDKALEAQALAKERTEEDPPEAGEGLRRAALDPLSLVTRESEDARAVTHESGHSHPAQGPLGWAGH